MPHPAMYIVTAVAVAAAALYAYFTYDPPGAPPHQPMDRRPPDGAPDGPHHQPMVRRSRNASHPQSVVRRPPDAPRPQPMGNGTSKSNSRRSSSGEIRNRKFETPCTICLEEIKQNIANLNCGHNFHRDCIKSWFQHSQTCPNCKKLARII